MWIAAKLYFFLVTSTYSLQVYKINYIKWMQMNPNDYIPIYYTWIYIPN